MQPIARDVALQSDGTLVGRVLDAEGRAIDGAVVILSQDQQVLGRTTTDAEGVYRFADTKGGVYRVTAGRTSGDFRVWPALTSPPGAQSYAAIVQPTGVVRGQFAGIGIGTAVATGTGIAAGGVGLFAMKKASDVEDDMEEMQAIIHALSP